MHDAAIAQPTRETNPAASALGLASDAERAFFGDAQVTWQRGDERARYRLDRLDAGRRTRGGFGRGWEPVAVSVRDGGAWRVIDVGRFHKRFGLEAAALPRVARASLGAALHAKLSVGETALRRRARETRRAIREHAAWAFVADAMERDFTRAQAPRGPGLAKARPRPAIELAQSA